MIINYAVNYIAKEKDVLRLATAEKLQHFSLTFIIIVIITTIIIISIINVSIFYYITK